MSSSASLPSPETDYATPLDAVLNKAFWDAALTSVGARIRALEAVKADWEELIAQGTGQALAVIQANVEPQLVALTAIIDQLKADVAAAEDAIAVINAGGINMSGVVGLSAALALKADLSYVDAAIAALKGDAPAAYDTLVEIATKLSEDDTAIAGLLTAIATKANKATKLKVGAGLSLDGVAGSDAAPVEGDLSADRLLGFNLAAKALAQLLWTAGTDATEAPISPVKLAAAISARAASPWTELAPVATTSGTAIDFTDLPNDITDIELFFNATALNAASHFLVQLGVAGLAVSAGYKSGAGIAGATSRYSSTAGFIVVNTTVNAGKYGTMRLHRTTGNVWVEDHSLTYDSASEGSGSIGGGSVTLSEAANMLRLISASGTAVFNAGTIQMRYK